MDNIERNIDNLLSQMTIAEKIGQLNQICSPLEDDDEIFKRVRNGEVGSFIMSTTPYSGNYGADIECDVRYEELINKLQRTAVEESRLGIPVIFGRDVLHGHRTVLPIPLAMAASFDDELVRKCYRNVARESARYGVNWTFAPMLDLSRDPRWGRCIEGAGEDPYLACRMAAATVCGFQGDDLAAPDSIAACAKHFIGYGASEGGRDYNRTEISDNTLRNYYLPAFKSAVQSGVQTVMSAFSEISGQPVSSNRWLLTELLKDELGFDGFVVSDWGAIQQLKNHGVAEDDKQAALLSFNAGIDMDMVDSCYAAHLEELINEGRIDTTRLDDAVRRILRVKFNLGLFDRPYVPKYDIDTAAHRLNARKLAAESMVLLKNNNSVLPLADNAAVTLAGEMSTNKLNMLGAWCCDGRPENVVSVYEGIKNNAQKCAITLNDKELDEKRLKNADINETVIVCFGDGIWLTGEAHSVAEIGVWNDRLELAKKAYATGKRVVAVLFYGRPAALEELEPYCDAILWAWHPGVETGNAVFDVLFGKVNPSGKLPITLPRRTGQIPIYYNVTPAARNVNGYYGNCDLPNYNDCDGTPMYPFGYGLSYSRFKISDVTAENETLSLADIMDGIKFKIKATVENISDVAGGEVVQLYVHDKVATIVRPLRELKGYKKLLIKPHEKICVDFEIGFVELGFYNTNGKFIAEKGEFEFFIGNSCYADNKITVSIC